MKISFDDTNWIFLLKAQENYLDCGLIAFMLVKITNMHSYYIVLIVKDTF